MPERILTKKPHRARPTWFRGLIAVSMITICAVAVLAGEVVYALYGFGLAEAFANPAHDAVVLGNGQPLRYIVIGDSTAAGRGAPYADGIAMKTAEHLAKSRKVTMVNLGVSGATFADIVNHQLTEAAKLQPDLVLCSAGANDVTHFTSTSKLTASAEKMVAVLSDRDGPPVIVFTCSPDMGAVPRFLQPLRWIAGIESKRVNRAIMAGIHSPHVAIAPVYDTGPLFAANPGLFAADRFHPNSGGYATWLPLLYRALDDNLKRARRSPH